MMVMVVAAMSPDGAHNAHDPQSDERVAQSLHGRLQRKSERVSECVCVCVRERERERERERAYYKISMAFPEIPILPLPSIS
jgi:hypothetical protein